ncbi:hypothetical protein [Lyngbya sp. CCY1209]|uniref:hypothetical protein n=1 Tax=Lyngbya sp. CCY1209 TaxID=2886103 RepID=UPI002D20ACC6|nr:hypothetical protein [Lyngbya sp. CCY1209]MEB3881959.1 hypothetical protein [Lyngbya sp. CCY1209]
MERFRKCERTQGDGSSGIPEWPALAIAAPDTAPTAVRRGSETRRGDRDPDSKVKKFDSPRISRSL